MSRSRRTKEIAGIYNSRPVSLLTDGSKNVVTAKGKLRSWNDYIMELFEDVRPEYEYNSSNTGLRIQKDEARKAIDLMKAGKASGPENVPAEILKLFDYTGIDILTDLFNTSYDTGIMPDD